jgi:hypothetical protein
MLLSLYCHLYNPTPDVRNEANPSPCALYRPYFWNSQSRLSSGHTCRVLSHLEMQWKWKACCVC